MDKKVEFKTDNPVHKTVLELLESLNLETGNAALVSELMKIKTIALCAIYNYCCKNIVQKKSIEHIIKSLNTSQKEGYDIALIWPAIPASVYIKNIPITQLLAEYREGFKKCFKLALLAILSIELVMLKNIKSNQKIKIVQAFLNKIKEDKTWQSGKNGKIAIDECQANYQHVITILDKEQERQLIETIYQAFVTINLYRERVKRQYHCIHNFSFGMVKDQGLLNLKLFDKFLNSANQIARNTSEKLPDRIEKIQNKIFEFSCKIKGSVSDKIKNAIIKAFEELEKKINSNKQSLPLNQTKL